MSRPLMPSVPELVKRAVLNSTRYLLCRRAHVFEEQAFRLFNLVLACQLPRDTPCVTCVWPVEDPI